MKPPKFILNSQGVITHKIVQQDNGAYRVFPADPNGNVTSQDPNKSPTLDEATCS
jgi:predicted ATPase